MNTQVLPLRRIFRQAGRDMPVACHGARSRKFIYGESTLMRHDEKNGRGGATKLKEALMLKDGKVWIAQNDNGENIFILPSIFDFICFLFLLL